MKRYISLFCLALLTGCVGNLHRLKELNPSADDFNSSLASEYLAYADSESEQGRHLSSNYYAGKGLSALKGEIVEPEKPDASLSPEQQTELANSRKLLMSMETDDMKRVAPQKLARAQLLFDCWQHQLSKDLNEEKAPCADEFKSGITELEETMDFFVYNQEATQVLTFVHGSSKLSEDAAAAITKVAQEAKNAGEYTIELQAHAKPSQHKLAINRLRVVRAALIRADISSKRIEVKKPASSKAVALSSDKSMHDSDKVNVTIKTHNPVKEP